MAKGFLGQLGWLYHSLGRGWLLLGRLDDARRLGDRAVETSVRLSLNSRPTRCTCSATSRPIPTGSTQRAASVYYRQALALAEPRGMRPLVAHCHLGLGGSTSALTGARRRQQEYVTTATTMYRDMGMTYWLEQAERQLQ